MKIPTITTTIDPAEMRAKYSRVLCQDGDVQVTATAEIVSETQDGDNYHFQMGLDYPRRGTHTSISFKTRQTQDGQTLTLPPVKHWMTQEDFDGMLKDVPVKVPTFY